MGKELKPRVFVHLDQAALVRAVFNQVRRDTGMEPTGCHLRYDQPDNRPHEFTAYVSFNDPPLTPVAVPHVPFWRRLGRGRRA